MRAAAVALAVLALVACEGSRGDGMTVFAAASLTDVLVELEPEARYNFAGSDELATQLREGARADVYAAATSRYPEELFAEGLLERPRVFATNRLVIVVPRDNPARIASLRDASAPGTRVVVAGPGVPAGDYAREVLESLGATAVLERVVSEEDDVRAVVGKVALGEADAGFVYATDARAAGRDVRSIDLPGAAAASVRYAAAVVRETDDADDARAFVERLLGADGRRALTAAGFGVP